MALRVAASWRLRVSGLAAPNAQLNVLLSTVQDQPRCLDSVGNENNCIEVEEAEAAEELEPDQVIIPADSAAAFFSRVGARPSEQLRSRSARIARHSVPWLAGAAKNRHEGCCMRGGDSAASDALSLRSARMGRRYGAAQQHRLASPLSFPAEYL